MLWFNFHQITQLPLLTFSTFQSVTNISSSYQHTQVSTITTMNTTPEKSTIGSKLTCISCRLLFQTHEEQKEHYHTDFHRYNLKRKIASLPPLTFEAYIQKIEASKNVPAPETVQECNICGKRYSTTNAFKQHLKSKKHQEALRTKQSEQTRSLKSSHETFEQKEATTLQTLQQNGESPKALSLDHCLFCSKKSADFKKNMKHMTREHSFFIPDIEYVKHLPDFIEYLSKKVSLHYICLYCNGKGRKFHSLEAVQSHMRDMSHCKLEYDGNEEEYAEFYDFSTYNAQHMQESVSDHPPDPGMKTGVTVFETASGELVLRDKNKVLGHRSLQIYYKQRPRPHHDSIVMSLLKEYRKAAALEHQRQTNIDPKTRQKMLDYSLKVALKANIINRKHFRNQNMT